MAYYWLVITCSCLGSASLQYLNGDGSTAESFSDSLDSINYQPLPYGGYFNLPSKNELEYMSDMPTLHNQFYRSGENQMYDLKRNRRMAEYDKTEDGRETRWQPSLAQLDKSTFLADDEKDENQYVIQNISDQGEEAIALEKKNFSPWGGKRDKTNIENMWAWKRAANIREPSMPKRVRFSPWGGKRSRQMVYKPGTKGSKLIFSTSIPELTRIVTNYSPISKRLDFRGFQFVPSTDKRHPIKILALSTKVDERALREALPYKTFIESIPRIFKPGHTYSDVALKTDGKRKVKFSAWGGKRSPPIIGPIWTPVSHDVKEGTLDAVLVIRNKPEQPHLLPNAQQL